jgi:hypothetical protein
MKLALIFITIFLGNGFLSQELKDANSEKKHQFNIDVTCGANRFIIPDWVIPYEGGPEYQGRFNFSYSANINYIFKTSSKLNIGGSIGFSQLGTKEVLVTGDSEDFFAKGYTRLLNVKMSLNFRVEKWRFTLNSGVALFLFGRAIHRSGKVYYGSHWGGSDPGYRFGPNVQMEVGREVFKGSGFVKSVNLFLRPEYHFATHFLNSSFGVSFGLN